MDRSLEELLSTERKSSDALTFELKSLTETNKKLTRELEHFQQEASKFKSKQALAKVKLVSVSGQIALIKQEKQKEINMLLEEIERMQLEITGLKKTLDRRNSEEGILSSGLKEGEDEALEPNDFQDLDNYFSVRDEEINRHTLQRSNSVLVNADMFKSLDISPHTVEPITLEAREFSPDQRMQKLSPDISNFQSVQCGSVVTSDISGVQLNKEFQEQLELQSQQMMDNYEKALATANTIVANTQAALKTAKQKLQLSECSLADISAKLDVAQQENESLLHQLTREKFEHAKVLNSLSKYVSKEKEMTRRASNLSGMSTKDMQTYADSGSSASVGASQPQKSSGFFGRFF